jgi:inositol phosphorylceramide mannosyltransferase catalytic subunit
MIPHVIHRVWLGGAMPKEHTELGKTWERMHPGWDIVTWTDDSLPPLRNQHIFDSSESLAQRADIARYEILMAHGGVYVDTDFEAVAPIEALIADLRAFVATEDGTWLGNAILGATAGHELIATLVAGIPYSFAALPEGPINEVTGPKYVTAVFHALRAQGACKDVGIFPSDLFYPYHFSELHRRGEDFPFAFAVHHWAQSWRSESASGGSQ